MIDTPSTVRSSLDGSLEDARRAGMHIHAFRGEFRRKMYSQKSLTAPFPPLYRETNVAVALADSWASAGAAARPAVSIHGISGSSSPM